MGYGKRTTTHSQDMDERDDTRNDSNGADGTETATQDQGKDGGG